MPAMSLVGRWPRYVTFGTQCVDLLYLVIWLFWTTVKAVAWLTERPVYLLMEKYHKKSQWFTHKY